LTLEASSTPEPIREPKAVEKLLGRLIDARTIIHIWHPKAQEGHLSTLVALKPYSGLYLDSPPESVLDLYHVNDSLQVRSQLDGTDIRFRTKLQLHSRYEGYAALLCDWPDEVHHYERRLTFRVRVGGQKTSVQLELDDAGEQHRGRLVDLSIGGFGAMIDPGAQLSAGEVLDCNLAIQGQSLTAKARIQSIEPVPGNRFARLGARFVDLPPLQERTLSKLILELDRQSIQHSRGL
jgi:c-di-GMP-binding flagellar brake protein YcgR